MKKVLIILLIAMMMAGVLVGCGGGTDENTIIVGSKQFTENIVLAEMYAQLIEHHTDINVERRMNLGGTPVIFPALMNGEVHLYPEYSGTVFNEIMRLDFVDVTTEEIFRTAVAGLYADYGVVMFNSIGINNTFAIGVLREKAEAYGLSTLSDLAAISEDIRFGGNHIFFTRDLDGYPNMVEVYGINFIESLRMDQSLLYDAIVQGSLDAIMVYATDAHLLSHDMVILDDNLGAFPAYQAAPVILAETLERFPELNDILDLLAGRLTDDRMQQLNYEVAINNRTPADVASEFLNELGLI